MATVATKKAGGDAGVQLTFPANFQKAYSQPMSYFPSSGGGAPDIMIGADFQSSYHQEKRAEANRSVMNGLQARKTAERLLLTGPHNYHLPKPVLGQRKYANPSYGMEFSSSTRRDNGADAPFRTIETGQMGAGMRGGVVTSMEGQQFYQQQLARRISQLNRMNALAQGYAVEVGQPYVTRSNEKDGSPNKVQFFLYLNALLDAIQSGDIVRFTFENFKELLDMLFAFAPTATREDFVDMRELVDEALLMLRDGLSDDPSFADIEEERRPFAETLLIYLDKMRAYIVEMDAKQTLSGVDRATLSKSLIRSLGFNKLQKYRGLREAVAAIATGSEGTEAASRMRDFDGFFDDDETSSGGDSWFGRPARAREDDEAGGIPRAPFAGRAGDPARERFGARTGALREALGDGEAAWFGYECPADRGARLAERDLAGARADDRIRLVFPLGEAGYDPAAEGAPAVDDDALRDAVEDSIKRVLRPLGFAGDIEEADEFVTAQYPDTALFVGEVVRDLEEQTYSRAQIARGMEQVRMPFFADYIAENTGDVAPARIAPAARPAGLGGVGALGAIPPIWRDRDEDGAADIEAPAGLPALDIRSLSGTASTRIPADRREAAIAAGIPRDRDDFNARFRTPAQLRELGQLMGDVLGRPYTMRAGTTVRNAKTAIIRILRSVFDPAF